VQLKKDNPEKLATGYTRRKKTPKNHNTICVEHHYTQTNTNNVDSCLSFWRIAVLSILLFTTSDYPFDILTFFLTLKEYV